MDIEQEPEASRGSDARPIGVFDSGIGGLTVVRALRRELPGESILYFGDAARVPYGTKSPETVVRFTRECLRFLVHREVKLLIVACNSASAVALPVLADTQETPMLGVIEPGVRAALARTRRGSIGVIGTEATIASGAYRAGLTALRPELTVHARACPLFVPLVEEGWVTGDVPRRVAETYLRPLLAEGIDTLILGCTHYPLLRPVLEEVAGPEVVLVDSAEETSRATAALLAERGLCRASAAQGSCTVFVSDRPRRFAEIGAAFLGEPLDQVTLVDQGDLPWYDR